MENDIFKRLSQIGDTYMQNLNQYESAVKSFTENLHREIDNLDNTDKVIQYLKNTLKTIIIDNAKNKSDFLEGKMKIINFVLGEYLKVKELENNDETSDKFENTNLNQLNNKKLNWTGNKNILIFLFQQLKKIKNDDGKKLITNSNEDIAIFLINNFIQFENNEISTLTSQLNKLSPPKKAYKELTVKY